MILIKNNKKCPFLIFLHYDTLTPRLDTSIDISLTMLNVICEFHKIMFFESKHVQENLLNCKKLNQRIGFSKHNYPYCQYLLIRPSFYLYLQQQTTTSIVIV